MLSKKVFVIFVNDHDSVSCLSDYTYRKKKYPLKLFITKEYFTLLAGDPILPTTHSRICDHNTKLVKYYFKLKQHLLT